MRTKVLLATPLKGDPKLPYLLGVAATLRLTDADYMLSTVQATYVQTGRQNLVGEARKNGCDELIFVDSDIGFGPEHVLRLRSHENVDIVGALYAKRQSGDPKWIAHATGEPQKGDLIPVNDIGFGLCRIKMSVFDRLDEFLPQRRYRHGDETPETEYFPVGLTERDGWRHPEEARVEAIRACLRDYDPKASAATLRGEILRIIAQERPLPVLCGEDVSMIRLCKAAGIPAYADSRCVVRHFGEIGYPAKRLPL